MATNVEMSINPTTTIPQTLDETIKKIEEQHTNMILATNKVEDIKEQVKQIELTTYLEVCAELEQGKKKYTNEDTREGAKNSILLQNKIYQNHKEELKAEKWKADQAKIAYEKYQNICRIKSIKTIKKN